MYRFWGKVKLGQSRGKKLGFPTANLTLRKNLPFGIYISQTKINRVMYPSMTFIGKVLTFNETNYLAETNILDFDKNIYGQWISVRILKKIRNNKKFKSAKNLVAQMEKDKIYTKEYFKKYV